MPLKSFKLISLFRFIRFHYAGGNSGNASVFNCKSSKDKDMIKSMLIAGVGGFVGTCGRFLIRKWSSEIFHGPFPLGTFLVNVIGCFLIGIFFGLLEKTHVMTPGENVLLITGFCGGFTTFSTFADDIWVLGNKGDWGMAAAYLAATVVIGILLVWAGRAIIR